MDNDSDLYLRIREKEGRRHSDEAVGHLPDVPSDHPLRVEWQARTASAKRLLAYLARLPKPMTLLDLGCGNGWLANQVASVAGVQVAGVDRNRVELEQAARVFGGNQRARFIAADIFSAPFPPRSFNLVLIASAIQYFADLPELIRALKLLLKPTGEAHIMDSPLYRPAELAAARERTRLYYEQLGFPSMAGQYHHHTFASLDPFCPARLYDPQPWAVRLRRAWGAVESPFPWIRLRPPF